VRATLNDELMHESGFESEYHRERARRHAASRRTVLLSLLVVIVLCALAGEVGWLGEWALPIPHVAIAGLAAAGLVGQFLWLMIGWFSRPEEQRDRRAIVRTAIRTAPLMLIVAAVLQLAAPFLPGIPKSVVIAALVLGLAVAAVAFVKNYVLPWMEDQI
jgi:hypothetical protein